MPDAAELAWAAVYVANQDWITQRGNARASLRILGEKLILAKEVTKHGHWSLKCQELGVDIRTAQRAMKKARGETPRKRQLSFSGVASDKASGGDSGDRTASVAAAAGGGSLPPDGPEFGFDMLDVDLGEDEDSDAETERRSDAVTEGSGDGGAKEASAFRIGPQIPLAVVYREVEEDRLFVNGVAERALSGDSDAIDAWRRGVAAMKGVAA